MVIQITGGDGRIEDTTAKHIFDRIGKDVYDKVKTEAEQRSKGELKGTLSQAKFDKAPEGQQTPGNTCELKYQWHTNVTNGRSYPCRTGTEKRFSEVSGGECDDKKIKGSNGGACAPFRRLNLCVRNLENINNYGKINNDTLLADVCLAALHEGDSIRGDHDKYKQSNEDSQLCTELARSFADIGDIIRGKDLYRGNNGKDKLEENLKNIFGKIHDNLTEEAKKKYQDGAPEFYKLREDWWYANRRQVWKAIRCSAPRDANYFRQTVCSGGKTPTQGKCRCIDFSVPTYFDYVPQFLRWFEEWGEEFCRLRKHKLQNAINKCRYDENKKERYCDLNGYDCKGTARGENKYKYEHDCIQCSFSCTPFTNWIDNQKEEFLKQKNRYQNEIKKEEKTIQGTNGKINSLYAQEFYEKLREDYGTVNKFLQKLNEERICKDKPQVLQETADHVDFTKEDVGEIFSRTKYCRACPLCGLGKQAPPWDPKKDTDCDHIGIKTFDESNSTPINLLVKDKGGQTMVQKLKSLCNDSSKPTIQKWKCHYEGAGKDYCVLQDTKKDTQDRRIMPYEAFFNLWINQMLDDSIEWKKQLNKCINNVNKSACIKGCKKPCECFEKWVQQKKTECEFMEKHFDKQKDMGGFTHYTLLQYYLSFFFKEKITQAYGEKKSNELMNALNNIEGSKEIKDTEHSQDAIKILLKHEEGDAKKCKKTKEDCKKPQQPTSDLGRADHHDPRPDEPTASDDAENEDEVHDDEITPRDLKIKVDDLDRNDPEDQVEEPPAPAGPDVCDTVKSALEDTASLQEACRQKYGYPQRHWGWKCISDTTTTSGATTGSVCIPPRRRRLYVKKLHEWANSGNTQSSQPQTGGDKDTEARGSEAPSQSDKLRTAFIESAAVETFFLWHKYKAENTKRQGVGAGGLGGVGVAGGTPQAQQQFGLTDEPSQLGLLNSNLLGTGESIPLPNVTGVDNDNPQSKLQQTGEIPNDFLRQMFYTLGDYRDLCVGNTNIVEAALSPSENEKMEAIQKKIQEHINNGSSSAPRVPQTQHSVENPRVKWWNTHGPDIWNAMVCALTYKEDTSGAKGTDGKIEQDPKVKEAFFGTPNGNPGPLVKPTTQNGTFESKYQYNTVKLEEENSGPKTNEDTQPPTLKQFTSRPTYFRYLEEWGENFCKERKKRLEKIKVDCMEEDGTKQKYSGDGEECTQQVPKKDGTVPDLEGPSCAISCRSYKKWIQKKKIEFEEQSNAYKQQKQDAESNNAFSAILTKFNEAKDFLQKLGSCSKTNNNDNGDGKIEFHKPDETFRPAENCKPCSSFKINCKNGKCTGGTQNECNGKTDITANDIQTMEQPTEDIGILVSDNSGNEFNGLEACRGADIFKGIRNEQWKCGEYCGVDICEQTNVNGKKVGGSQNQKHIIQIRALFKRWLENFLKDYNKINDKISQCMKNREGSTCINQCENICECVGIWINKKNEEWKNIKKRFFKQYDVAVSQEVYTVRSFLQQNPFHNEVHKAIKPCTDLDKFEESKYCAVDASSGKKDGEKSDVVECLLHRLKKEIESCSSPTSGESQPTGEQKKCVDSTPVEDDEEDLLLEEEEKNTDEAKKMMPKICEGVIKPEPVETEETCTPAAADGEQKPEEEAPTPEQNEVEKVKDKAPKSKPVTPAPQPTNPPTVFDNPQVQTALMTSTLAWSVGIAFTALSYWLLKVCCIFMYFVVVYIYIYIYI
ncbi:hypothetical protein PFDG_00353 [Plasmodium falciparum Dd2]|uniref:Erythrocyte membrane protein 1 n=2 Tax=Plasmodium falciparum TaxID=5833 RepID=A0A0L7LWQ4_PLAF4|nr:hypothetical protein PFDG_00353 [Plasmodium falciparum Dd2]